MKSFLFLFGFLWKIWFIVFFIISFLILLPVFVILSSKKEYFVALNSVIRFWCKCLIFVIGIRLETNFKQKINYNYNYIFCPNHKSYIDIALIYASIKSPILFIGKEEIVKYPIFGLLYKKHVITVKRKSIKNSFLAYKKATKEIKNNKNIVVFPEGGIFKDIDLKKFKNGAFKIAEVSKTPIIPISIFNSQNLFRKYFCFPGKAKIIIHKEITTNNKDFINLKNETWNVIKNSLNEIK